MKIELIDGTKTEYENVCNIGAEVVKMIFDRMAEMRIDPVNFGNVMAVACGGVARVGCDPKQFGAAIEIASQMWELDGDDHQLGLKYAPRSNEPGSN